MHASAGPAAKADGLGKRVPRSPSLRVYVVGFVVLFVVGAAANVAYQRRAANSDATHAAAADAAFGAAVAARDIAADVGVVRTTVASIAASPAIAPVFGRPAACTLRFTGAGAFATGHLDIVGPDGTVACSSLAAGTSPGYAAAPWLTSALKAPVFVGPIIDARSGKQVVLAAAPISGKGAVVAFLNLDALGPGLASTLGGPRHFEFVVSSSDGKVVLGRSVGPAHWIGALAVGAPFPAPGQVGHRDLDGTPRLYGQATVDQSGWKVFAGASSSQALAAATRLNNRQLVITLGSLLVLLSAALVFYRRIARPIAQLSADVRAASERTSSGPITVPGPAEVVTLVDDFNELIPAANRELEVTSRLAAIVESSTDAIFAKTLDGVITTWNAGAEEMLRYTPEEIIGRNVSQLVPLDRRGELASILEGVAKGRRFAQLETQRLRKDGSIVDVSISVSPVCDATGAVIGASTVSRDMTERNRAEADRLVLNDQLHQSERLESLGQLAGGIAHDFNNLLSAIMNYAAFVAEATADNPEVRDDVEQIQIAADRAAQLTKQLLIFGRRETITPETLDLNIIVAEVHNLLSRSIGEHIELVVEAGVDLPTIRADRGQIEQVLLNLAINARDAMLGGGTLTIETSPAELAEGHADLHPPPKAGRYVELAVSDTGTGISASVIGHIFEPFFTTKPKDQGTGLGLATVWGIVTEAGGSMSVHSEVDVGTTFRVYLPVGDPLATGRATEEVTYHQGHGETILVVEDQAAVLEVTSRILRQNGYDALEAGTFEEALSLAATHDFQLLLTDSVMPRMSGRLLAKRVEEIRPGRPVLYMSGYSEAVLTPRRVLDEGVALIQKPFNRRTMLDSVHAALTAAR